jgi:hypothetical protein
MTSPFMHNYTPWTKVLLEKFPEIYGTGRFITVFWLAHQLSVQSVTRIQSTPSHHISLRSILFLYFHLRLDLTNGLFLSGFQTTIVYTYIFLVCPIYATFLARPNHLDFISLIVFGHITRNESPHYVAFSARCHFLVLRSKYFRHHGVLFLRHLTLQPRFALFYATILEISFIQPARQFQRHYAVYILSYLSNIQIHKNGKHKIPTSPTISPSLYLAFTSVFPGP